jgi:GNAT superfamily N-acetyltransferase
MIISLSALRRNSVSESNHDKEVFLCSGYQAETKLKTLTAICLEVYKEDPYRWEGTEEEQMAYINKNYIQHSESIICLATSKGKAVGLAMGLPLEKAEEKFQTPFKNQNYDVKNFFYLGEMVILKEYRSKGFGKMMFQAIEKSLLQTKSTSLCFSTLAQPGPDLYWQKGFEKHPELNFTGYWREIDQQKESPHHMIFWLCALSKKVK